VPEVNVRASVWKFIIKIISYVEGGSLAFEKPGRILEDKPCGGEEVSGNRTAGAAVLR
jgi:hypothetical protein